MFVISMVFAQDVDENNVVMSIIVEENAKKASIEVSFHKYYVPKMFRLYVKILFLIDLQN